MNISSCYISEGFCIFLRSSQATSWDNRLHVHSDLSGTKPVYFNYFLMEIFKNCLINVIAFVIRVLM